MPEYGWRSATLKVYTENSRGLDFFKGDEWARVSIYDKCASCEGKRRVEIKVMTR